MVTYLRRGSQGPATPEWPRPGKAAWDFYKEDLFSHKRSFTLRQQESILTISIDALLAKAVKEPQISDTDYKPSYQSSYGGDVHEPEVKVSLNRM